MIESVPHRFEALLDADPTAPAVVLVRPDGRERVWVRAAVEHRAVRLAGACAAAGVPAGVRLAFRGHGLLDRMATAWYALATGRLLVDGDADFTVDDEILRVSELEPRPYLLRACVRSSEPAAWLPGLLTHGELLRRALGGCLPSTPMGVVVTALATGRPLRVEPRPAEISLSLVYAA